MASWNNRTAFANKGGFQRQPSLADFVSMLKFTSMEARKLRFIGPSLEYREHQIEIKLAAPSKKDGKTTTGFPKMCLAQVTSKAGTVCPYCEAGFPVKTLFMQNVIDRALQKRAPAKKGKPAESEMKVVKLWDGETKGKMKDIKSDLWTPLLVLKCTSSLADRVVDASEANQKIIKGKEVTFGAEHPRHGFDLLVKFDKDAPGASMYSASKTMNTKLSDEELAYPLWNLAAAKPETLAVAQKQVADIVVKAFVKDKDTKEMSPMFPDKADPKIWADWLAQHGETTSKSSRPMLSSPRTITLNRCRSP